MKYLLILFTVFTFGQASNQMVTFTQASSLGFTLQAGQSHVTSNKCMTKSEALAKYNLNASNMSAYTNNQLVPRSTWVTGFVGVAFTTNTTFYNNNLNVCDATGTFTVTHHTISGLAIGVKVYFDAACTQEINNDTTLRLAIENDVRYAWRRGADNTITELFMCIY